MLREAVFDPDVAALGEASLVQALSERLRVMGPIIGRDAAEKADHGHRLLRTRCNRPCRRPAEQRDELAPLHCLTPPVLSTERNSTPRSDRRLLRCGISAEPMTAVGLVSRALPVHTAMRKCPGYEGGPF